MSVRRVQLRRGTHAENDAFTGAIGEISVDTTNKSIRVHDGTNAGGFETLKANLSNLGSNVLEDNVDFTDKDGSITIRLTNVAHPTGNNDVATKQYVDSAGEGAQVFIDELADVVIAAGGEAAVADKQVLIWDHTDSKWRNATLSGDVTLTAHTGTLEIGTNKVVTTKILDANVTNAKLLHSKVTIGDTGVTLGTTVTAFTGLTGLDFTNANATIGATMTEDGSGNATVLTLGGAGSQVVITGDLVVSGGTTTVNTATLDVEDTVIRLNKGIENTANTNDIGVFMDRGTNVGGDAIFFWDEGVDRFKFGLTSTAHTETDFGGSLTLKGIDVSDFTATGASSVSGKLNADGGIDVGSTPTFSVATTGAITATSATSAFKTGSTIGNLTLGDASITDSSGTIAFGSNDLSTSGDVSITGAGTLAVAGASTLTGAVALDGGATVKAGQSLKINKGSAETDRLLTLNADAGSGTGQNAVIAVDMGDAYATATWQQDETTWAFSHSGSFATDLTVGQSLSTSTGGISVATTATIGTSATVGTDLTVGNTINIKSQPTSDLGIVFNSDRGANNKNGTDYDVKLITVESGSSNATEGIVSWDDDQSAFVIDGGALHSNTDLSVGTAIGTKKFTVAQDTGNTVISGTLNVSSTLAAGATTLSGDLGLSGNDVTNAGDVALDSISSANNTIDLTLTASQSSALDIATSADSYLLFNTTAEKSVFGKKIEAPTASKIADFTFTAGNIASASASLDLNALNLTTSGNLATTGSGTLTVAGTTSLQAATVAGLLTANGGITADGGAFTVADSSGNVATTGTLSATGDLKINTNKFVVTAASGNTSVGGTLAVTSTLSAGATTIDGDTTVKGDISITTAADPTNGIIYRSNIADGGASADQVLLKINDGGSGPSYETLTWDTDPAVFDFSAKVNSTGDLSVGAVGSPKVSITASSGATETGTLSIRSHDLNNASQNAILILNSDADGAGKERDAKIEVERGSETNSHLKWNETDNQWEVSNSLKSEGDFIVGANKFTVASSDGDTVISGTLAVSENATFAKAVEITGDLTVHGTTTTINSTTVDLDNTIMRLNSGQVSANNTNDIGFFFERGTAGNDGIFIFDEGDDFFKLGTTTDAFNINPPDFGSNLALGGLQLATLELKDDTATSLDIRIPRGTPVSLLKFDTTSGAEKVVFGKVFEAVTASKIGDIEISNGQIQTTHTNNNLSFNDNNLSTSGTASFGATTIDAGLNLSNDGITNAGAISGATTLAMSGSISGATTLATISAITLAATADINLADNATQALEFREGTLDGAYLTLSTANGSEAVVVNEDSNDIDFRVEGNGDANLILAQASNDRVGIKTASPAFDLDVTGTLGISGLADLNGGIDVNASNFTVSTAGAVTAAGATAISNTLNVTTGSATALVVEKADGTDVLNVDTTNSVTSLTGSLKVDTIQSLSGTTGNFNIKVADNVANALTIEDTTGLDYIKIDSSNGSEEIVLNKATTLNETLSVTGVSTFVSTINIEDSSGGIIFNSDDTGAGSNDDATLLSVQRGTDTKAILSWDETRDEFNLNSVSGLHLVGKTGGHALTIGGANSASQTAFIKADGSASLGDGNLTVSTAGAIVATSINLGNGGIVNAGSIGGATTVELDKITDKTGDGLEVELPDTTTNALDIKVDGGDNESYIHINSDTKKLTLGESTNITNSFSVSQQTTLGGILNLKSETGQPLILANSDLSGSNEEASAILLRVKRGALTEANLKWDETSDCFEFDKILSAEANFQVGTDAASPKATINSTSGNLSTVGTISATSSITTESVLNFKEASQGAILFNSDLAGGSAPDVNDDFGLTVNRGSATNAIFHWDEGNDAWEFNNAGSVTIADTLSVNSDLTLASGSITSSSGTISFGNEALTTTGSITAGSATISGGASVSGTLNLNTNAITSVTDIALATISATSNDIKINLTDSQANAFKVQQGSNETYIHANASDVTLTLGEKTILSKTLEFTTGSKGAILFNSDLDESTAPHADNDDYGLTVNRGSQTDAIFHWDEGNDAWQFNNVGDVTIAKTLSVNSDLTLSSGSITSSSGAISFNDENLSTSGTLGAGATTLTGNLTLGGNNIVNAGSVALDSISASDTNIALNLAASSATALVVQETGGGTSYLTVNSTANTTTLHQNTTFGGTVNITTPSQGAITFNSDDTAESDGHDFGLTVSRPSAGTDAIFHWDETENRWEFNNAGKVYINSDLVVTGSVTGSGGSSDFGTDNISTSGTLAAGVSTLTSLNLTGDGASLIKLNSDLSGSAPTADCGITVERGTSTDATLFYAETSGDTWKLNRGAGVGDEIIVTENDTLFTLKTGGTGNGGTQTFKQTTNRTLEIKDSGIGNMLVENSGGVVSIGLQDNIAIGGNLQVEGNITGDGDRVAFADGLIQLAAGNDDQDDDLGFYAEYEDSGENTNFAGLIYQPDSTNDLGVWKLFDKRTTSVSTSGSASRNITVADTELARLDVSGVSIAKNTHGSTVDEATSSGDFTNNNRGISVTFKLDQDLTDGTRRGAATVTNSAVLATSVIMATASHHVDVHPHTVATGSFKFDITNRKGNTIANDTDIVINFVIL